MLPGGSVCYHLTMRLGRPPEEVRLRGEEERGEGALRALLMGKEASPAELVAEVQKEENDIPYHVLFLDIHAFTHS